MLTFLSLLSNLRVSNKLFKHDKTEDLFFIIVADKLL